MQRPLQEHIAILEQKIQSLSAQASDIERSAEDRYQATVDLDFAERALSHFRKAYELEQKISMVIQT
jgi:hypothetical protein